MTQKRRLEGLDIARFIAFVGMVVVNFKTVMPIEGFASTSFWARFAGAFEGRAAATFVVLAGIGLGLAAARSAHADTMFVTIKRALFLLVIGLLNALIFEADILHYYAFYFLFGMMFLRADNRALLLAIGGLVFGFVVALVVFDYDQGWDWKTLSYTEFWQPAGMIRNLFFNGWHPVVPWLAFFLYGLLLSRLKLHARQTQISLLLGGIVALIGIEVLSYFIVDALGPHGDEELGLLFMTEPVPPMPFYMVAGMSAASLIVGLCLMAENTLRRAGILSVLAPAGRQTLTLYIAHIMVGMGALEALGMLSGTQTVESSLFATLIFCVVATFYAYVWARYFKRGPVEWLMRKLAG